MDAKPHRPLRAFRMRDENQAPSLPQGKALHQRNKSSPALSSLANAGGFRFGAKRTAFADLSNTARPLVSTKDDTALQNKKPLVVLHESTTIGKENEKPAPLGRPAQRPLSVSGIKGFLNSFKSDSNNAIIKAAPSASISSQDHIPILPQKTLSRKTTAVFREPEPILAVQPIPSTATSENEVKTVEASVPTHTEASLPPADTAPFQPPVSVLSQEPHIAVPFADLPPIPSQEDFLDFPPFSQLPPLPTSDEYFDVRSDGVPLSEYQPELPTSVDQIQNFGHPVASSNLEANPALVPPQIEPERAHWEPAAANATEEEAVTKPLEPYAPTQSSERQEYWEQDFYEGDGYTTARSFKSKGDYTTGPLTIVMAPKMTSKVEKELAAAAHVVQNSRTVLEMEEEECWDTTMVAEYGDEIFGYMRNLEERMRPNPYYMDNQTEVQWSMRSVLMDWLVQVHHRFGLLPETLFLCVNLIDRFLSCKVVSLGKLQLVGATAIFIAAKYEEINCPSIQELIYMVDGSYTVDEILKAERFMLSMLQFELGWPGPMSFLRRVSKADDYDLETRTLAKYFLELTVMDERFVGCIPSFSAAGAHCLARLMLKKGPWSHAHVYFSQYTYSQLRPLLLAMLSCCEDPQKHHGAIFDKYGDKRFKRASFFVQAEIAKGFVLPITSRVTADGDIRLSSDTPTMGLLERGHEIGCLA